MSQACGLPFHVVAAHVGTYLQHAALLGEVAVALEVSYAKPLRQICCLPGGGHCIWLFST